MPKICVEIELDTDTGKVMVGMEPAEAAGEPQAPEAQGAAAGLQPDQATQGAPGAEGTEEAGEKSYMQPVKDVETALQVARDMLQGSSGAQAQAAQAEGDFSKGFGKGAGAPAGRPTRVPGA